MMISAVTFDRPPSAVNLCINKLMMYALSRRSHSLAMQLLLNFWYLEPFQVVKHNPKLLVRTKHHLKSEEFHIEKSPMHRHLAIYFQIEFKHV